MKKIKIKRRSWFRSTFQLRGSVIPAIIERSIVCAGFGLFVSILYYYKLPVSIPVLGNAIPSVVLGLVLVFRTNTAYDRFWEGRRLWGSLVNTLRNLAWQIWVNVDETTPANDNISVRDRKIVALRLLIAFALAKKKHLRSEPPDSKLASFLSVAQYSLLQKTRHMPLEIARWLGEHLKQEWQQQRLPLYQLTAMQTLINTLMECVGGCERILKTPLPLAYSIHIKQLVLLYCLVLPFQFVRDLNWWTAPFTALVSLTLFGIEEIGIEIENPFGTDANDLQLEAICNTIEQNIEEFIATEEVGLIAFSEDAKTLN